MQLNIKTVACAVILFAVTLSLQGTLQAQPVQSKRALVRELIEVTKVPENMQKSLAMVKQMQQNMIIRMTRNVKNRDLIRRIQQKSFAMIMEKFSWENFQEDFINVYAEVFSENELRGLIKFYRTPLGQKLVDKMPLVQQKLMPIVQKKIIKLMPEVKQAVARIVAEEKARVAKNSPAQTTPPKPAKADAETQATPKK